MTVTFKCGHAVELDDPKDPPVCKACGERQIANVKAPAPRFTGACVGPLVVKG
jgi:DNA-directed RNA polymerase subunit RPC12/RpoP